jgi:hypothetical protein
MDREDFPIPCRRPTPIAFAFVIERLQRCPSLATN